MMAGHFYQFLPLARADKEPIVDGFCGPLRRLWKTRMKRRATPPATCQFLPPPQVIGNLRGYADAVKGAPARLPTPMRFPGGGSKPPRGPSVASSIRENPSGCTRKRESDTSRDRAFLPSFYHRRRAPLGCGKGTPVDGRSCPFLPPPQGNERTGDDGEISTAVARRKPQELLPW
jgi:hypothetical protein